jgi:hypothetical protein
MDTVFKKSCSVVYSHNNKLRSQEPRSLNTKAAKEREARMGKMSG